MILETLALAVLIDPTTPKPNPPTKPPVTITKVIEVAPNPEPITWEQNPQNCNETTHYIAAESPFYCILKPQLTTTLVATQKTTVRTQNGSNTYPSSPYQCTRYAKDRRPDIPNSLGDARFWYDKLASMGWSVGLEPRAGAIGIAISGNHAIYVEYVNPDGTIHLSERNWDYRGSYRERDAASYLFRYIY